MILDIIKTVAPAIASALLGPIGGAAVTFLANALGADEPTKESIEKRLSGMNAAEMIKLKELDLDFQKFCLENNIKLQLAQIDVNREEARSGKFFIAGWRPAVGWVGAVGLAYVAVVEPVSRFVAKVFFDYHGEFPVIDVTLTMQVLSGMIGFGIMRTVEKVKGAEGNR